MTDHLEAKRALDEAQYFYLQMLLDGGCKFVYKVIHFGKPYVWMKDVEGTLFLERVPMTEEENA